MYRGRPPHPGGYPPPFEVRGPRPPRPYPGPDYRNERGRGRPPHHHGFHAPPDSYRRSPPRRRYPFPGSVSHRPVEHWAGGPTRERSPSPRGPLPVDHNLVITVGNELTSGSCSAPPRHHDRDFPSRSEYEPGRARSRDHSPDRSRGRSRSRPRSQSRSPDRSRAKSRGRSKSRPRSQSRSPDRNRAKSRGRSKSRPRSQSRSPDRNRAKSRPRSQSRSPDRTRAKSRGRSKSRAYSRSGSRSRSRSGSWSRGRSRGRSVSRVASQGRSKSRPRSSSSSSSSSSGSSKPRHCRPDFEELGMARRRKELEEMLGQPTKSILKKRNDSEDSPSVQSVDSPRGPDGTNVSRVADQLLQAFKGMDSHTMATVMSELRSDPQMVQRAGFDSAEIKEIFHLLGETGTKTPSRVADDIDDEEKFLYGDAQESKPAPAPEPPRQPIGLDMYAEMTEEALYGDYTPTSATPGHAYSVPPGPSTYFQAPSAAKESNSSSPAVADPGQNLAQSAQESPEEYEKIQDLLKTLGLDLGITEISKMAARTKERLHGNKPPKTPTRRRRYSSDSSNSSRGSKRRSRSSSSSSGSSSRSGSRKGKHGGSWSSADDGHRKPLKNKPIKDESKAKAAAPDVNAPDLQAFTPHPGMPIPPYPPPQVHGMMPPAFPPSTYGQYGSYMPYLHQQWPPPMYPPPNMSLRTGSEEFPGPQPYQEPYRKMTPDPGATGSPASLQSRENSVSTHRKMSEQQNNESQKQKVLEEREKLREERKVRMEKKSYLMKELERLRKQQGELLRKKRREKEGHKDPLLLEISRLQDEVMTQISDLRRDHEEAERKRGEIDKVALILGLSPSDRPVQSQSERRASPTPPDKKRREREERPKGRVVSRSSALKQQTSVELPASSSSSSSDRLQAPVAPKAPVAPDPFEYYDAGNHWCKDCNVTSGSMFDFFTHLHSKTHRKTLDPYDRPWASTPTKILKSAALEEKLTKPAKGSEFLRPVRGFFCLLCQEFYGDAICAEEHVTTHAHNEKYKKQMYENPLYEQRRNLDRQAGLSSESGGKKRKHEGNERSSRDEEKDKPEKDKKKGDGDGAVKEEKCHVKKEEPELAKSAKNQEGSGNGKKVEEEHSKPKKRDEKHRHSKEDEDRGNRSRYGREEESRYRYRGDDDDDRYDKRSKYDDDDKYKYGKYPESRTKYNKERDEGNNKPPKEAAVKPEPTKPAGKPPAVTKPEPPSKPYELPKVFCGPSPAMRAKLRKQNQEAGKPTAAAAASATTLGKFTWKKKENPMAKMAEKIAAEFTKEDEAAANQKPPCVEDSFAKSMAVAKEIAEKLSACPTMPPPWESNGTNRGRMRPNLRTPHAAFLRGRKTFLSTRPPTPGSHNPLTEVSPVSDRLPQALSAQSALLAGTSPPKPNSLGPPPPLSQPPPTAFTPAPPGTAPWSAAPVAKPAQNQVLPTAPGTLLNRNPTATVASPSQNKAQLPTVQMRPTATVVLPTATATYSQSQNEGKSTTFGTESPATIAALSRKDSTSTTAVTKPTGSASKPPSCVAPPPPPPPPFQAKPSPCMVKIVADVAAPGVPESEQTRTVFVKPPPLVNMSDRVQKSDKLKTHLAAAKAQDLFGVFYSGIIQSPPSSSPKPDSKTDKISSSIFSPVQAQQPSKPQPQTPVQTQSQPPASSQQSVSSLDSPSRQNSEIQIASVWSMTCDPPAAPVEVLPGPPPPTSQPEAAPSAQLEDRSLPQAQLPTAESEIPPLDPTAQSQLEPNPDTPSLTEPHSDGATEPEPKRSPKTRGKKMSPVSSCPVRQTRSQTRHQTQVQHQQPGPDTETPLGHPDLGGSDPKGPNPSNSLSEEGAPSEGDPHLMQITPEALGLPSDMTSLDFDSDLNFD